MTVDAEKQRNHYFDLLKYLLFILVVLIHNPLPGNIGGALTAIARCAVLILLFQVISTRKQEKSSLKRA